MSDETRDPVSRRAALKVLGVLPLAGVVEAQQPAQAPRQPHATPNQPAGQAAQPARNAPQRKFFTAREWRTVSVLADDIIPHDDRSGSATDAGVPAYIDYHMSVPETDDNARTQLRGGLRWMDTESRRRFGRAYHQGTEAERHALLDDIALAPPGGFKPEFRAGAAFFANFRNMVASGFFSSAIGHRDLQYQGNVFNPNWNGCPQPALDKLGVGYDLMTTRIAPQRVDTK